MNWFDIWVCPRDARSGRAWLHFVSVSKRLIATTLGRDNHYHPSHARMWEGCVNAINRTNLYTFIV